MNELVDVVLYVVEDPSEDNNLEARLDLYFGYYARANGWRRLKSDINGTVYAASFQGLPVRRVQEILSNVEWGKRSAFGVIKDVTNGFGHADIWSRSLTAIPA